MRNIIKFLFLLPLLLASCESSEESNNTDNLPDQMVEVSIGGTSITTKTAIGDDLASTKWSIDDQIAVWAKSNTSGSYTLNALPFVLRNYGTSYSSAVFTTSITEMAADTYTYYGVYPTPLSVSNNTTVSYNIASTQSGVYDGLNDIMVAAPFESSELTSVANTSQSLSFSHLMHMIRIEIPDGRNYFGLDLTGLDVTFPQEVVGNISFDATSDNITTSINSSGSKVVSVKFDEPFVTGDGNYIWMFVNPTTISGSIEFLAYGADGAASDVISTYMYKSLEAGNVTPIKLSISLPKVLTAFNVEISAADVLARIGEPLKSVTLTLPSGVYFEDGTSSVTIDAQSDSDIYGAYLYNVSDAYATALKSGSLGIKIETASVEKTLTSKSLSGTTMDTSNYLGAVDVPYFFYTNMSDVTDSYGDSWTDTDISGTKAIGGLTDWYAGKRCEWSAGSYIALRHYSNAGGPYPSRVNGATLSYWGLKTGVTVKLKVVTKMKWTENKCSYMDIMIGKTSGTDFDDAITNDTGNPSLTSGQTSYKTVEVSGVTNSLRLAWKTDSENGTIFNYDTTYIYEVTVTIITE
ncbi:MAG: hypothetical protein SNG02_00920 [Rikenellaceae bacterium]